MAKKSIKQLATELAQTVLKECEYDAARFANSEVIRVHYKSQTGFWQGSFEKAVEKACAFRRQTFRPVDTEAIMAVFAE